MKYIVFGIIIFETTMGGKIMQKEDTRKLFRKIPVLETDRLVLRRLKVSDYADMFEYSKSDKVTKYLLWRSHPDAKYTRDYLAFIQSQ